MKNRPFQLSLNYIYSGTDHVKAIKQKKDLKARSMTALTSCVKQSWKYTSMDMKSFAMGLIHKHTGLTLLLDCRGLSLVMHSGQLGIVH